MTESDVKIMLSKNRVYYIIVWGLFILILLFSNNLITSIKGNNFTKTTDIFNSSKEVFFSVDEIHFDKDIFGSLIINGWAFCETELDNTNKEIWAVLSNDKNTYKTMIELIERRDVYQVYKGKYKIKNKNHGYFGTFSTIGVKNGIYELGLYCKENDEDYGFTDTGIMIKKRNSSISQYMWQSVQSDLPEISKDKAVQSSIDIVTMNSSKKLEIKGWAFIEGIDTLNQIIYVRLTNSVGESFVYDTKAVFRKDVGIAYNNSLYDNSGFEAVIGEEVSGNGEYIVEILIKNDGKVYLSSKTYKLILENYNIKTNTSDDESNIGEKQINSEIKINITDIEEDSRVKYSVDSCLADKNLIIQGWAYITDINASDTSVFIAVTSSDGTTRVYNTNKKTRPDVAKVYENELYSESGFKTIIPLDAIDSGDNIITIIAQHNEMLKAEKTYIFNYTVGDSKK